MQADRMPFASLLELLRVAGEASTTDQQARFSEELTDDIRNKRGGELVVTKEDRALCGYLRQLHGGKR